MAPPIALSRALGRRASSSSSSSSSASTSRIRAQGPPPPPSLPSSTPPAPPPSDARSAFIVQPTKEKTRIVVTETVSLLWLISANICEREVEKDQLDNDEFLSKEEEMKENEKRVV